MPKELLFHSPEPDLPVESSDANGILDATQNAIIDAAENVTEVFDKANPDIAVQIHNEPLLQSVEFWIGMAFVLSVLVLLKPVGGYIVKLMRGKIENVRNQIDEAVKLRDDAQDLLAQYERKFIEMENEVDQILDKANSSIANQKKLDIERLKETTTLKENEINRRIASAEDKALAQINATIGTKAVELAQNTIIKNISEEIKRELVDKAIKELDKFVK